MTTVLKFSSKTCAPCKTISHMLKDQEMDSIDVHEQPEKAAEFGIRRVPTLVFLKDGKEVHRHSGILTLDAYKTILIEINDSKELNDCDVMAMKIVNAISKKYEE